MMMYQLPIDMMTRMIKVALETKSPPFHSASRPYGLSMTSVARAGAAGAAAGTAGGGGETAEGAAGAAGAAVGAVAGCDCAWAACGTAISSGAISRAASAARRFIFNIASPDR